MLIQIGGLGVMTCIATIALFLKRRISLGERRLLMQSAGSLEISGVVKLVLRIIKGTVIIEGCGAILLSIAFCPQMGFSRGIWNAVFHSVSAFCNSGIDIMGKYGSFSSFTTDALASNPLVCLTLALLIISGGIGFLVWGDIVKNRLNFSKYEVHSKIAIIATAVLVLLGTALFFAFEYNHSLAGMSFGQKLLSSFFQSVTPRTAGFNTVDMSVMSNSGTILIMLLMFIGGSPGSTAGGIKTTTFIVLLLGALASAKRRGSITIFKRRLDENTVVQASAIATVYTLGIIVAVMLMSALEPFSLTQILFEAISAIGTVGLTLGITTYLTDASQIILMLLMFAGRVGGLSLMLVLAERRINVPIDRPTVKILIG